MDCLDATRLAELFGSSAGATLPVHVDEHLDRCDRCRDLVAAFARALDPSDAPTCHDTPRGAVSPLSQTAASDPPPMSIPASRWAPGQRIAGRFRLVRVIGEGGMGVVWEGHEEETGRRVALKALKVDTPELEQRVLREARAIALVGHPNVVEVHEVLSLPDAPPVLVMDLLEGESLDRLLSRVGTLAPPAIVRLLLPLVAALRAAHARGVLHRDLKPQNVFLAREDEASEAVVMLLDFGLAKIVGLDVETLTRTGAIIGTPYYMAPEQLYGEPDIDRRADVWAVGAIAYEALSGRRPIEGGSYAQLVRNASRRVMTPIADLLPGAPRRLTTLVDRMIAHERAERPELGEVHAELDAIERGGATGSRP